MPRPNAVMRAVTSANFLSLTFYQAAWLTRRLIPYSASWSKAGYPSSFTIESKFENSNKNIVCAVMPLCVSSSL